MLIRIIGWIILGILTSFILKKVGYTKRKKEELNGEDPLKNWKNSKREKGKAIMNKIKEKGKEEIEEIKKDLIEEGEKNLNFTLLDIFNYIGDLLGIREKKKRELKRNKKEKEKDEKNIKKKIEKKDKILEDKILGKKKMKETFINKEIKDHGVGTFGSLQYTYDKEKRKEEELMDMSNLKPEEIKEKIDINEKERKNIFNKYKELREKNNKDENEITYMKQIETHLNNLDDYIGKMRKIYYKISLNKSESENESEKSKEDLRGNIKKKEKLSYEEQNNLFKFPDSNKLDISDGRNIFETRIQSFNTDIKIVNERKIIYEIDNMYNIYLYYLIYNTVYIIHNIIY